MNRGSVLFPQAATLLFSTIDAVLPGAGYMAMAVEATARIYNEFPEPLKIKGFSLRNAAIKKGLTITEDDYDVEVLTSMELVDTATAKSPAWATFPIGSVGQEMDKWSEHSTGLVKVGVEIVDVDIYNRGHHQK